MAVQKIGFKNANKKPTKDITFLPCSALAPRAPWSIRASQACIYAPLPCAAGNSERVPEALLFVLPRRKETCIWQDRPFLRLLALAIRQAI